MKTKEQRIKEYRVAMQEAANQIAMNPLRPGKHLRDYLIFRDYLLAEGGEMREIYHGNFAVR
jgi:hypothetical protein